MRWKRKWTLEAREVNGENGLKSLRSGKKTANQVVKLGFLGNFLGSEKYPGFGLKNAHPSRVLGFLFSLSLW
jgi:hypothetical protein